MTRILFGLLVLSLLAAFVTWVPVNARAGGLEEAKQNLEQAKQEAASLSAQIANGQQRLDQIDTQMVSLEGRILIAQSDYQRITQELAATRERYSATARERDQVLERVNARARAIYIQGPGASLDFFLSASSLADLSSRVEYMGALQSADNDVAVQLTSLATTLKDIEAKEQVQQQEAQKTLEYIQQQKEQLVTKREDARYLLASLEDAQARADDLVARWGKIVNTKETQQPTSADSGGPGPLYACPVPNYDWIANDFGAPRWGGGYHTHQGNDIGAAKGAPIVAPFPGVASDASNDLGGMSVYVRGSQGYVYNAHLSAMGTLGNVNTGDVIGYVGNSGDARGGPYHDHFEWHPGNGDAVDPYPSLMEVC